MILFVTLQSNKRFIIKNLSEYEKFKVNLRSTVRSTGAFWM